MSTTPPLICIEEQLSGCRVKIQQSACTVDMIDFNLYMGMQFARHDNKQDLDDGHDNKQDLNDAMLWQGASMEAISSGVGVLQRIDSYPSKWKQY